MREQDYDGGMSYYQEQLTKKGITKEMFNMDKYAGLTARELQNIVDSVQLVKNKEMEGRTSGNDQ